jgi:integrase
MASSSMLPSGRFRGFARVGTQRDTQTFDRKADADKWAEKTEDRMRAGKWVKAQLEAPPEAKRTVRQAFESYRESEEWLEKGAVTRSTERSKQRAIERLLGDKALDELTEDDVSGFIARRRKEAPLRAKDKTRRMSGDAVRLETLALSAMLNYAKDKKWVAVNVAKHVKKPRGNRRNARLDDEVIGSILEAMMDFERRDEPDYRPYTFYKLLFTTVCRPGELAAAKKSWLRHNPAQIVLPTTKNEDPRVILLSDYNYRMLCTYLEDAPADCPYIFGTKKLKGQGWSPYNYRVPYDIVRAKLGLGSEVVAYLARHEGVSRLFERTTLSDGQIASISGHRTPQALWHYKHLRVEHQRGVMTALDQMITEAMERTLASSHPSEPMKPGEMLGGQLTP